MQSSSVTINNYTMLTNIVNKSLDKKKVVEHEENSNIIVFVINLMLAFNNSIN